MLWLWRGWARPRCYVVSGCVVEASFPAWSREELLSGVLNRGPLRGRYPTVGWAYESGAFITPPVASRAAGGEQLGTWGPKQRRKVGERGGGWAPAWAGAGGRGLRLVSGAMHVGVPSSNGEREGGREDPSGWASPRDGPHPSVKWGEWERDWQVGPTANLIKFEIVQTVWI
jgi:hypothetical protein